MLPQFSKFHHHYYSGNYIHHALYDLAFKYTTTMSFALVVGKFSSGYKYMKKAGRKYPDRLADPCKHLSVNRMAAGSRMS